VKIGFTADGWTDYQYWQDADTAIARRINVLIRMRRGRRFQASASPNLYAAHMPDGGLVASMTSIVLSIASRARGLTSS